MSSTRRAVTATLVGLTSSALLAGCDPRAVRREGEPCVASSECDVGLLCDLALQTPICSGAGTGDDATPAADTIVDGDGGPVDAAPADAAIDAPVDALPIDAVPIDAAVDAAP